MLERDDLLSELREHARASRTGDGRIVLVGGEAGAGKTSLVERFRRDLTVTTEVMWGSCEPMAAPAPFGPLLDFATELVEDFEDLIGWQARRYRLFTGVLASLKATGRHRLLVFEDLHWADEATFDLLRFLSRRIVETPVLLVATYRDDELGPEHPLRQLLGDVAAAGAVHRLKVPRLSLDAVRTMASEVNIDPVELFERSLGNPFFVSEVLAAGGQRLPEKVTDAVAARASRLSSAGRHALELASVLLKHELNFNTLSALVADPSAIDECIARGLLVRSGSGLAFRHDLVREAVETSLLLSRRREAHIAILANLEATRSVDHSPGSTGHRENLTALAHHATEASDVEATLRYATASGGQAMKFQANREARIQFSRVVPHAHLLPLVERAQMYLDYAKVSCITGAYEASVELCTNSVELWRAAGRRARAADALVWLAQPCRYLGRDADFWKAIGEAEEIIEDASLLAELEEAAGGPGVTAGDDRATEAAADLRVLFDTKVRVYQTRGEHCYPNVDDILSWARKCQESYRRNGHLRSLASEHHLKALARAAADRFRVALRESAKSLDIARANDFDDISGTGPLLLAMGLGVELRFALALPLLLGVAEASRNWEADYLLNGAEGLLALAYLHLGDWTAAEEYAYPVLKRRKATPVSLTRALIALGRLRLRRGETGAEELLDEAAVVSGKTKKGALWAMLSAVRAEAALATGDHDLALHHASGGEASFDARPPATHNAELAYWRWKAGGGAVRPEWAVGPFLWQMSGQPRRAATRWRRLKYPYEEAMALTECGDETSLTRAYDLFDRLGAKPAAAEVAGKLRRAGARVPRARTATNPTSLTRRERQVLELMSQGLRNADIAKANQVSTRTVDHQVSAVLSKLGARTRTEAVSLAGSLGILPARSEGRLQQ